MTRWRQRAALAVLAAAVAALGSVPYRVPQAQQALVLRLGRPVAVQTEPGLHFKRPLIDSVSLYDTRWMVLQPPTEPTILGDQKRVEVTSYTLFRIADPLRFNQTVQTLEQARSQLIQIVGSSLRRKLGQTTLPRLLSAERDAIIGDIRQVVADAARPLGIDVADVRIERAGLPPETSQAIYDRMTSERQREAKELRAQGFEWAQEIQAKADRDRSAILSQAQLHARVARSEADALASALFAEAFNQNADFYAFYRAMQTYRHAMADASPTLMLSPQSDLLRFFNTGAPPPAP